MLDGGGDMLGGGPCGGGVYGLDEGGGIDIGGGG